MKTKLTQLFGLLMLCTSMMVNAQVPEKDGSWNFNDAEDMLKAEIGVPLELTGTQVSVPGPVAGDLATEVGTGSYLKLTHGIAPNGGGTLVNEYTIMMDVLLPTLGLWHPFIQTDITNTSDADLWSRNNNTFIGTAALGYGTDSLLQGVWYRMVISVKNGTSFNVYLNTELFLEGVVQDVDYARYALDEAILLFADNTLADDNPVICSEVAVWNLALSEAQIIELGSVDILSTTSITVSGEGDVSTIDTDDGTLQMTAAVLPIDATYQTTFWSVTNGSGNAIISPSGLLKAKENGTVTVTATAKDDPEITATKEITLSNQTQNLKTVGHWKFDDPDNMLKAEKGLDLELFGSQESVEGPADDNLATEVGTGSYLKVSHGISPNGGGNKVNAYTIMMDVSVPDLGIWHPFFQTDITNTTDADLWSRGDNTFIGTWALGYSELSIERDVWYRMLISVKNGTSFQVYLNTELYLDGNVRDIDGRYALAEAILLFTDDTPENDNIVICSELAMWDVALTEDQIIELGEAGELLGIANKIAESVKVYPNPAVDKLNVTLTTPNAKLTIYNSLGRKIEEIVASDTQAEFDVSKYAHGVYFIKVNNETTVKFIK